MLVASGSVRALYGRRGDPWQMGDNMQAYCLKCRAQREMKSPKATTLKNGKAATQGICPVCGTKMSRIGKG